MLSESDIDRYHFRMTDNHDGATFDYDVDFESDLLIIESDATEHARVSNILGKAQKADFLNTLDYYRILELKSYKPPDDVLTVRSEGRMNGKSFRAVLPICYNSTVSNFAMHLLSISQYLGMKDSVVEYWRLLLPHSV